MNSAHFQTHQAFEEVCDASAVPTRGAWLDHGTPTLPMAWGQVVDEQLTNSATQNQWEISRILKWVGTLVPHVWPYFGGISLYIALT